MIIRNTPKDIDNYICVTSLVSEVLHSAGFIPKYMDDKYFYYCKNDDIENFMRKEKLKCNEM